MTKQKSKKVILLLSVFILSPFLSSYLWAHDIVFNGQAGAWITYIDEWQVGMRYIPEVGVSHLPSQGKDIDALISLNSYTGFPVDSPEDIKDNAEAKPYRLWLRYKAQQYEMRLGLQKINFGPAKILRSLMWFDQLDARDPLQLTDGVYALLGRYYFLNNANIWVWGLYGNDDLKGLEVFKTDKGKMEFGGRYQFPVPKGEMALSFNQRVVDKADWSNKMSSSLTNGLENRYALDGSWDVGVGLWLEAQAGEIKVNSEESLWQEFLTIGTDYTFAIGPGVHLLYEHFIKSSGPKIDKQNNIGRFSALSMDFSINVLDSLNAIGYYDWKEKKIYTYLGLRRTYDDWMVNLSLFSSPKGEVGVFRGDGIQCLITYNH